VIHLSSSEPDSYFGRPRSVPPRSFSSIPLQPLRAAATSTASSASSSALRRPTASPLFASRSRIPWATTASGTPLIRATSPYLLLSRSFATPAPGGDPAKEAAELKKALSSDSAASLAPKEAIDKTVKDVVAKEAEKDDGKKLTLWEKVKKEARHYWHGTKLLGKEIRISAKLQRKVLNGGTLTRREQRQVRPGVSWLMVRVSRLLVLTVSDLVGARLSQLKRTTTDLLRLIPFSVFVIIPGLELVLPVFLRFFPNMLPSTFEDKFAAVRRPGLWLEPRCPGVDERIPP
jgi:LETM1 and EF-hand domain-containing protein 1